MIKLRTLLLHDSLYIILSIVAIIYSYLLLNYYPSQSKYKTSDTIIEGYIDSLNVDGDKLTLLLKGKEKIIVNYYFQTIKEKKAFDLKLGDQVKITGEIKEPQKSSVFNLFDYKQYLYHNNIYYFAQADKIELIHHNQKIGYDVKQSIIDHIDCMKEASTYVKALVIGDDSGFKEAVNKSYQINGVSHLFAISGSHISFLAVIILWGLKRLKVEENKRYYIVILFLLFYMFLTNYTGSVVRAVVFFALLSVNKIFYFHIKTINVLLLTLFLSLMWKPGLLYDVGFQFSFIISLFLIKYQSWIAKTQTYIGKTFIISLISFLSSIPISINNFFQINILSIMINLFFVPYVTFILFPLSFLSLLLPFLDNPLCFFVSLLEIISLSLEKIKIGIIILAKPSFLVTILYYGFIILLLNGCHTKKFYQIIPLLILVICHYHINYFNKDPFIVFLDVGQGDSIFINLPHNQGNILIDTGGKLEIKEQWQKRNGAYKIGEDTIIPYLKSIGVSKLHYFILTHGDEDHLGESIDIVKQFKVKEVILNSGSLTSLEEQLIEEMNKLNIPYRFGKKGDAIKINDYRFDILSPITDLNENDNSLVIHSNINNQSLLFVGDISSSVEKLLIEEYPKLKVDILKVGHHGSITSTSEAFLNSIEPTFAFIEVGLNNRFNHPSDIVLRRLIERNIKIFKASTNGSIKVIIRANDVSIIPVVA